MTKGLKKKKEIQSNIRKFLKHKPSKWSLGNPPRLTMNTARDLVNKGRKKYGKRWN